MKQFLKKAFKGIVWQVIKIIYPYCKYSFGLTLLPAVAAAVPAAAGAGGMSAGMGMLYGGAISAAGGILGGLLGKGDDEEIDYEALMRFKQLPEFPEAEAARGTWAEKIQQWGQDPYYGALPMNWEDIKKQAQSTLSRYYWGGVTEPGLAGKMRSQAARLNRPVNEAMIGALGQQEKIDLMDLMTNLRTEEVGYGEAGRKTWLQSMMNLAGLKPSYITPSGPVATSSNYGMGEMIGDVSSGIGSLFSQYAKNKQMDELYTKLFGMAGGTGGMPLTSQGSLVNAPTPPASGAGWWPTYSPSTTATL